VAPIALEVLVREAELIAMVSVLSVQDVRGTSLVSATLELRDVLKAPAGLAAASVEVRFQPTIVPPGTSRPLFSIGPAYRAGELAVVFLKASPEGSYFETVRGFLGKRTIVQGRVSFENIGLDEFLARIRTAVSSPSSLITPSRGKRTRPLA
jgi:hypothetical protein